MTVEDALDHAFKNVSGQPPLPIRGKKTNRINNVDKVIGFQTADAKVRVRLDFDPAKGLHVNEEDFHRPPLKQKVVHLVEKVATGSNAEAEQTLLNWQENRLLLFWNKWTKRF